MPELDTSNVDFASLLELTQRDPKNPLATTLVTNYELDTLHKSAMLEDTRAMMADQRRVANLTPKQIASQMIHFDEQGNPVMPDKSPRSSPDSPRALLGDDDEVSDDGIRLHSDNVTHIHQASGNGMTPGKMAAMAAGIVGAGTLAALTTWGLMSMGGANEGAEKGPAKPPVVQPAPPAPSTAPGLLEKDPNP